MCSKVGQMILSAAGKIVKSATKLIMEKTLPKPV
jgi:hypothetical protein